MMLYMDNNVLQEGYCFLCKPVTSSSVYLQLGVLQISSMISFFTAALYDEVDLINANNKPLISVGVYSQLLEKIKPL